MNYNRMTIRPAEQQFQVFKMKRRQQGGWATDMAGARFSWFVSGAAKPQFTGTYEQAFEYIKSKDAMYMSEHGIAC
jgi:hypothetical protein